MALARRLSPDDTDDPDDPASQSDPVTGAHWLNCFVAKKPRLSRTCVNLRGKLPQITAAVPAPDTPDLEGPTPNVTYCLCSHAIDDHARVPQFLAVRVNSSRSPVGERLALVQGDPNSRRTFFDGCAPNFIGHLFLFHERDVEVNDTMPLARIAKVLFLAQAVTWLLTVALVAARKSIGGYCRSAPIPKDSSS
jgi:hypothetical protein